MAASGTYGIGRAALAYYIEGVSVAGCQAALPALATPGPGSVSPCSTAAARCRTEAARSPSRSSSREAFRHRAALADLQLTPSKTLGQNLSCMTRTSPGGSSRNSAQGPDDELVEIGPGLGALTGAGAGNRRTSDGARKGRAAGGFSRRAVPGRGAVARRPRRRAGLRCARVMGPGAGAGVRQPALLCFDAAVVPFLRLRPAPRSVRVFLLQRELAERLAAEPGTKDYGLVSVILGRRWRVATAARAAGECIPAGAEGRLRADFSDPPPGG